MKLLAKIGLCGLLAGGTATALYADTAGGWLSPNGVAGPAPTSASGAAVGSGGVTVVLSLVDIQPRVQRLREQIRADGRHIQHLQQLARKEKDVIKLNCVNDKLVQVKPQMNILDLNAGQLEGAGDTERMASFEAINEAAEAVRRLREEADQCVGEPVQSGGDTTNSYTSPEVPDDPIKGGPAGGFDGTQIEAPGYASPFN